MRTSKIYFTIPKYFYKRTFNINKKEVFEIAKLQINGKHILAIDDHNNVFQKKGVPFVLVGYVIKDYQSVPKKLRKKGLLFGNKSKAYSTSQKNRSAFEKRGVEFLKLNPQFCYTTISQRDMQKFNFYGRAKAMASLSAYIINKNNLDLENTIILPHRLHTPSHTKIVKEVLEDLLKKAEITCPIEFKNDEKCNDALLLADRVAYFLGGLRYHSPSSKWPFRHKKIDFRYIDEFMAYQYAGDYHDFE